MPKLTKAQRRRLSEIAAYQPTVRWPHAAFWTKSRTDESLVAHGLVERVDHHEQSGFGGFPVTWNLCKLTPAGHAALLTPGED